jgi:ABC-2 type transport system permease protein
MRADHQRQVRESLTRIWALIRKETYQVLRDPSSVAIGMVMPAVLVLLFGFGLSLDVTNVPIAIVLEDPSPDARELAAGFELSAYFKPVLTTSMPVAQQLMRARKVDGIVRIRSDFSRRLKAGNGDVQVIVLGTQANNARIIEAYAQGALGQFTARRAAEGRPAGLGLVTLQTRLWFNEVNNSHYFLVPGLIVLIMTLIGAFLTAMVMAREWERGTIEALFVTPVRAGEILLGKMVPYFVLGLAGLFLCVVAAKLLFAVPLRGSLWVLTGVSILYLLVTLGIGLSVSSMTKSQFVASQIALLLSFMPAMMLSGFLFDLRSMPLAIQVISFLLPARYYVALLQTEFLAGDVWSVILPNAAVLAIMASVLLVLTRAAIRKRLA